MNLNRHFRRCATVVAVGLGLAVHAWAGKEQGARPQSRAIQADSARLPMIALSGASFTKGTEDGPANERPPVSEYVGPFFMDLTEVTLASYKACVDAGACTQPDTAGACNWGKPGREHHPINCVDLAQAQDYCRWAGKRLPSEDEWEYAARGTDGRRFPWGNESPANQLCWSGSNHGRGVRRETCQVTAFSSDVSPFGISGMAGNVSEWTLSRYTESYGSKPTDERRVRRGGTWKGDAPGDYRATSRAPEQQTVRRDDLGFRCAQDRLSRLVRPPATIDIPREPLPL